MKKGGFKWFIFLSLFVSFSCSETDLRVKVISPSLVYVMWDRVNAEVLSLERSENNGEYREIAELNGNITFYADGDVIGGRKYCYKLRINRKDKSREGCASVPSDTPYPPPPSPSNLKAIPSLDGIFLKWVDKSENEEGFIILRCEGDKCSNDDFVAIGMVPENVTEYMDRDVLSDIEYCYRVYAYNDGGRSGFSNRACSEKKCIETGYIDNDGDGYGGEMTATVECSEFPSGITGIDGDCEDNDPLINPQQKEICDKKDNDCSGKADDNGACVVTCPCNEDACPARDRILITGWRPDKPLYPERAADFISAEPVTFTISYALSSAEEGLIMVVEDGYVRQDMYAYEDCGQMDLGILKMIFPPPPTTVFSIKRGCGTIEYTGYKFCGDDNEWCSYYHSQGALPRGIKAFLITGGWRKRAEDRIYTDYNYYTHSITSITDISLPDDPVQVLKILEGIQRDPVPQWYIEPMDNTEIEPSPATFTIRGKIDVSPYIEEIKAGKLAQIFWINLYDYEKWWQEGFLEQIPLYPEEITTGVYEFSIDVEKKIGPAFYAMVQWCLISPEDASLFSPEKSWGYRPQALAVSTVFLSLPYHDY
jgi:hypothetical protein